jgi:thiamine-phosphate pyrophosphorylase
MRDFKLYVITDERFHPGKNLFEVMEEAMIGGADIIQLRDKQSSKRAVLEKARQLRQLTKKYDVLFIVNDHIDVAIAVDADGVHLGQDDLPIKEARKLVGNEKIIGISTHSLEQAKEAEKSGADYIGVGPVFATGTKDDVVDPVTTQYVTEASQNVGIPFVAIGGIKLDNVDQVLKAGAKRICAVSEIVGASNIRSTCATFLDRIEASGEASK